MEEFEQAALTNYPTDDTYTTPSDILLFWYRKADDTRVTWMTQSSPSTTTTFNHYTITSTSYIPTYSGPRKSKRTDALPCWM